MPISLPALRRRLGFVVAALILGGSVFGCAEDAPPVVFTPVPVTTGAPEPAGTATPGAPPTPRPATEARPLPEEFRTETDNVLNRVLEMRSLAPTGPIEIKVISRSAVAEYLKGGTQIGERPRAYRLRQDVYTLLGLIPPGVDLLQISLDAYSEPYVLAFYDPDAKAIFLFEEQLGSGSAFMDYVLSHEFVHALQDQHYDLNRVGDENLFDWDAGFAFGALLEGDARNVDTQYLRQEISGADAIALLRSFASLPGLDQSKYPPVVIREISWPYDAGAAFLAANTPRTQNGILGIYAARPLTTEQIIHPDKYIAGEGATAVQLEPLTSALGAGWSEAGSANIGEFGWQNFLLVGLEDGNAVSRAAAGWGGDRFTLYQRDEARLLHLKVAWDSGAEAHEFWSSFVASLRTRAGHLQEGEGNLTWTTGANTLKAALANDTITLLVANDPAPLDAAARHLLLP